MIKIIRCRKFSVVTVCLQNQINCIEYYYVYVAGRGGRGGGGMYELSLEQNSKIAKDICLTNYML